MITVIVLAFLTQENKASKMQSTINQLKHGKGCVVRDDGTLRTVIALFQCAVYALKPVLHVHVCLCVHMGQVICIAVSSCCSLSLSLFPFHYRENLSAVQGLQMDPIITCVATSTQVLHMEWNKCVLYFRKAHLCFHVTCFNQEVCLTRIFQEGTPKCDYTFFSRVLFQSGSVSSIFFFFFFIFFYQL